MSVESKAMQQLLLENEELRTRLLEAEYRLEAIRSGAIDALVITDERGERIYTLESVDYNYRVMVENMNEGAVVLNNEGIAVFANKTFAALVGGDMAKMVGSRFENFLPENLHGSFSAFLKECMVHPYRKEFFILSKDGDTVPVSIYATLFEAGSSRNLCMIITDLSEQKRSEHKLQKAYEEVQKKVQERTAELQQVNESLRASEEQKHLALDAANSGTWEWDLSTNKNIWSEEVWKLFGIVPHSIEASYDKLKQTIHPNDRERVERTLKEVIRNGTELKTEWRVLDINGNVRWLMFRGQPQQGHNGRAISYNGIVLDITERKEAESALLAAKERIQTILESITDIYMFLDNGWRIVDLNSQAELALSKSRFELIGQIYWDVFPNAVGSEVHKKLKIAMHGRVPVHFEEFSKGAEKWIESHVYPSEGGLAFYLRDISDRKRMEEDLRHWASELTVANKELESFSYSISHDLRAPLRAIKGFSTILLEDYKGKLEITGVDFLHRIVNGADKMNELIDDMLSLSKISRQEIVLQEIDLSAMAISIVNELRQAEPERKSEVIVEENLKARGDRGLINIALSNIIGNAWKYSSKTPNAKIEFGMLEKFDETVYFVRDNGAGFDMKLANKMFVPFQRLHSEREFSGTGIGLAIVNRVIQRHGGKIWAESEVDKGATFYFLLSNVERKIRER